MVRNCLLLLYYVVLKFFKLLLFTLQFQCFQYFSITQLIKLSVTPTVISITKQNKALNEVFFSLELFLKYLINAEYIEYGHVCCFSNKTVQLFTK